MRGGNLLANINIKGIWIPVQILLNKDSSKHQLPIGENAKDIKNNEKHFKGYIPYQDKNSENLDYDKFYIN